MANPKALGPSAPAASNNSTSRSVARKRSPAFALPPIKAARVQAPRPASGQVPILRTVAIEGKKAPPTSNDNVVGRAPSEDTAAESSSSASRPRLRPPPKPAHSRRAQQLSSDELRPSDPPTVPVMLAALPVPAPLEADSAPHAVAAQSEPDASPLPVCTPPAEKTNAEQAAATANSNADANAELVVPLNAIGFKLDIHKWFGAVRSEIDTAVPQELKQLPRKQLSLMAIALVCAAIVPVIIVLVVFAPPRASQPARDLPAHPLTTTQQAPKLPPTTPPNCPSPEPAKKAEAVAPAANTAAAPAPAEAEAEPAAIATTEPTPVTTASAAAAPAVTATTTRPALPPAPLTDGSDVKAPSCTHLLSQPSSEPYANSEDAQLAMSFGRRELVRGNWDGSQRAFCKAVHSASSKPYMYLDLAQLVFLRRDSAQAAQWARRATNQEPTRSRALSLLGDALIRTGHAERARQSWLSAAGIKTTDETAINAMVDRDLLEAQRAMTKRDYARAERFFRRVAAFKPDLDVATIGIGNTVLKLGFPRSAELWLSRAAAQSPTDPTIQVLLGDTRAALDDQSGAEDYWRQALKLDPMNADANRRVVRLAIR